MKRLLTRAEVGKRLGITTQSVRKWEQRGRLHGRKNADGVMCFTLSEVKALQQHREENGYHLLEWRPRPGERRAKAANLSHLEMLDRLIDLYEERLAVLKKLGCD